MADFHNDYQKDDFKTKGPELLVDLAEQCAFILVEMAGLEEDVANQIGREVSDRMASHWGGQNIYVPIGLSLKLSSRDRQIYDEFTGNNHRELARKWGVSMQWIYKIVKAIRKEDLARRQHHLFPEE